MDSIKNFVEWYNKAEFDSLAVQRNWAFIFAEDNVYFEQDVERILSTVWGLSKRIRSPTHPRNPADKNSASAKIAANAAQARRTAARRLEPEGMDMFEYGTICRFRDKETPTFVDATHCSADWVVLSRPVFNGRVSMRIIAPLTVNNAPNLEGLATIDIQRLEARDNRDVVFPTLDDYQRIIPTHPLLFWAHFCDPTCRMPRCRGRHPELPRRNETRGLHRCAIIATPAQDIPLVVCIQSNSWIPNTAESSIDSAGCVLLNQEDYADFLKYDSWLFATKVRPIPTRNDQHESKKCIADKDWKLCLRCLIWALDG